MHLKKNHNSENGGYLKKEGKARMILLKVKCVETNCTKEMRSFEKFSSNGF
jgi:hypothetical protein